MFFRRPQEPPGQEAELEPVEEVEETEPSNCAWCGDPPNESGSHGICPFHAGQLLAQSAARHARRVA